MKHKQSTYHVLVIDDQQRRQESLLRRLHEYAAVSVVDTPAEAEIRLREPVAVVIAEQQIVERAGAAWLTTAFEASPHTLWILLAEDPGSALMTQTIERKQLYCYLNKPWESGELALLVKRALQCYQLTIEQRKLGAGKFSQEIRDVFHQIIQADKMISLGKMVAGIAHEINTPSGAIGAAIVNIDHHLKALIENFDILNTQGVTREDFQHIMEIVAQMASVLEGNQRRTSEEVRNEQYRIVDLLRQQKVQNSRKLAKYIARMDLTGHIDMLLALIKKYEIDALFMFFTHCHRIINSVRDIKVSVDILTHTVRALKSYSHSERETPELTDIHTTINTALTILKNQLKHRIHVEVRQGAIPKIQCYPSELSHVWINLIHNAIQAINGQGEILIETFATSTYLGVKVTDNGLGIPGDIQDRIFDIDFTTKPQGEGTGFGLYIAHQIVEKHGGTIDVISSSGKTTFEVHLPFVLPAR